MIKITASIEGISPFGYGKAIESIKPPKTSHDVWEQQTWKEKIHVDANGIAFIPGMAFKYALTTAAKRAGDKIPGKGQSTYTARFKSEILVTDNPSLGIRAEDIPSERLFVPSDGVHGSGKRVYKFFPVVKDWACSLELYTGSVLLEENTDIIRQYLCDAGHSVGVGRWRPENEGMYGRFKVCSFKVEQWTV